MKKYIIFIFAAIVCITSCKVDDRVGSLMKQMTLEEKVGQLWQLTGDASTGIQTNENIENKVREGRVGSMLNVRGAAAVRNIQRIAVEESRLGIPLVFGLDVIHGYEVTFPAPLAMASSWDMSAIEKAARIAAIETSCSGTSWTFCPMCDIARDPRWGRIGEGAGEDPYLGYQVAAAQVRGFQNGFKDSTCIAACFKHFALYGAPMAGRDYNTVEMSRVAALNDYLLPYKGAIDAGCLTGMTSFNEFESVPATANKFLMREVLRDKFGFKGMMVSDYNAVKEEIPHGYAKDMHEAAVKSIEAGLDMEMVSSAYDEYLVQAVRNGEVSEKLIDEACRRVLELKEKLGLLDDPYRFCREEEEAALGTNPEYYQTAREIARECIVLLKNENHLLPLATGKKIAVIGPMGNLPEEMRGIYTIKPKDNKYVSVYEGLCRRFGKENVTRATGCHVSSDFHSLKIAAHSDSSALELDRKPAEMLSEAIRTGRNADIIVASMGEVGRMAGEGASRSCITLPDPQRDLLKELLRLGKPLVLVVTAGRPLQLDWEAENIPAIVNAGMLGVEAGNAIADVLSGDFNPSGRLVNTYPRTLGQVPIYYNHKNTGRPWGYEQEYKRFSSNYMDVLNSPLYPFGYGLSYSEIKYGEPVISCNELKGDGTVTVSVDVTNVSGRSAVEVVQLYIHDLFASITRPVSELRGFRRITLEAGQTQNVTFEINAGTLGFYDADLDFVTEPGEFDIKIGPNSRDTKTVKLIYSE